MGRRSPPRLPSSRYGGNASSRYPHDDLRAEGRRGRYRSPDHRRGRSRTRSPPRSLRRAPRRDSPLPKRRRSPSSSSTYSSSSSSNSSSGYSSSRSRSLISCSTCSGYYSLHSSSSSGSETSRSRSRSRRQDFNPSETKHTASSKVRSLSPKESRPAIRYGYVERHKGPYCRPLNIEDRSVLEPVSPWIPTNRPPKDPRVKAWPVPSHFKPVLYKIDDNWVYRTLPEHLLIGNLFQNLQSKVQLLGLIESQISMQVAKSIVDIEIHSGSLETFASVKFQSGTDCYRCFTEQSKNFEALCWVACLDKDQRAFRRRVASALHHDHQIKSKPETPKAPVTCRPEVPCLLVDYEFFSERESSRDLLQIFQSFRPRGVERRSYCWHVHLDDEEAVEDAYSSRYSFTYHGRRIRPYMARRDEEEYEEREAQSKVSSGIIREQSLDDIRSLILQKTQHALPMVENFKILEPLTSASLEEQLSQLPVFNKKVLQRLQEMAVAAASTEEEEEEEEGVEVKEIAIEQAPVQEQTDQLAVVIQEGETEKPKRRRTRKSLIEDEPAPLPTEEEPILVRDIKEGCARLVGHFKQPSKTVWYEPIEEQIRSAQLNNGPSKGRASRSDRNAMAELTGKLSSLHIRQKQVVLGRSSIHSYGLFAGEDIEPGEFVIEYVGEVIRHALANIRERRLEEELRAAGSTEMASSYFFRLDLTFVVDATKIGNLARFVNHSCEPNCTAKVVQVEGAPHIVFYARKAIRRGDEITYDYKFAIEDDPGKKIRCLCGSAGCRRYLN